MSIKKDNIFVEHYDSILLDFIENSRKLIEKKTTFITSELRDLKEENEKLILQFTRKFLTSPDDYKKYLTNNSLSATPTSKLKSTKEIKTKDFISHELNQKPFNYTPAFTLNNKGTHFTKPFLDKYISQNKAKIEVKKNTNKKKKNTVIDNSGARLNSSNCFRNTESSLRNDFKKPPLHKSNKNATYFGLGLQNDYSLDLVRQSKPQQLSNKGNAICTLINSHVLTLKEKMFFWFTNTNIQPKVPKRKIIEDFKALIQVKLKHYENKFLFMPSSTAKNCLSFLKPVDEEEFKQLVLKSNEKELSSYTGLSKLLYVLLGIDSEHLSTAEMIQNLYMKVFKEYNITSIKQLITNVICNKISNEHIYQKNVIVNIIENYENCFETRSYLQQHRVPSFISFILKEIAYFLIQSDYNKKQLEVYQAVYMKLESFLMKY